MIEDADRPDGARERPAANDNGNAKRVNIDAAVLRIARLIGRQMAREEFERQCAANDNHPPKERKE